MLAGTRSFTTHVKQLIVNPIKLRSLHQTKSKILLDVWDHVPKVISGDTNRTATAPSTHYMTVLSDRKRMTLRRGKAKNSTYVNENS